MDSSIENLSPKQMIEQIAELKHTLSQLKELNKEMKHWLDVADEEIFELRLQNTSMTKQIKSLEILLSEKAHNEAETSGLLRGDELDAEKINAQKINKMEKEAALMMEENQKLTAELRNLQEEKEKDQANLRDIATDMASLKCYMEDVQLEKQQRDEIIHQKTLQLNNFEETIGEYTNIIEDLRLTNQEQKRQLEEGLERTSIAALNELVAENEGALSGPLSIAQEIQLQEKEAALMEENQKLTAEVDMLLRSLQEEKEKAQANLRDITTDLETFKCYLEEVQLEKQQKDEIIHQKMLQLNHLEKTCEEYTNIIEDLRLTNQEQKRQLEEGLERTSIAALNEPVAENEGALSGPLSIAQEIQLQEKEAALMEENQKLTAELTNLQEEQEKVQANLRDITTDLETFKCYLEEVQLEKQQKDEIIHQKMLQLNHFEKTCEEYTNIIEDLRLTNQNQRSQLAEALGRIPQSTAQGIDLIIPVKEETTSTFHSLHIKQEETEPEDETKPTVLHQHYQRDDQSCADKKKEESSSGWSWTFCLMSLLIIFLILVVFVAPRSSYQLCPLLRDLIHVLQPYVRLTYISRPPI